MTGTTLKGERIRKNFSDRTAAIAEKQRLEAEAANLPPAPTVQRTTLTTEKCRQAERAFDRLGDKDMMLCVDFFLANYRETANPIPLGGDFGNIKPSDLTDAVTVDRLKERGGAFGRFIALKVAEKCRPDTIRDLWARVGAFVLPRRDKLTNAVLAAECQEHICRAASGATNQRNDRSALNSFFNWCLSQNHCATNPIKNVVRIKVEEKDPVALPLAKVRALMNAAVEYKDGKLVPYFALGLFAALRPDAELANITWDDIDIEQRVIKVRGIGAKTRKRRVVEMSDSLVEWLTPHALKRTPIVGANFRKDRDAVRRAAGFGTRKEDDETTKHLVPWVEDYMRHTSISHHLAQHESDSKTAKWAGNSEDVIHAKYKALVTRKDAKEFWSIAPHNCEPVPLPKAA